MFESFKRVAVSKNIATSVPFLLQKIFFVQKWTGLFSSHANVCSPSFPLRRRHFKGETFIPTPRRVAAARLSQKPLITTDVHFQNPILGRNFPYVYKRQNAIRHLNCAHENKIPKLGHLNVGHVCKGHCLTFEVPSQAKQTQCYWTCVYEVKLLFPGCVLDRTTCAPRCGADVDQIDSAVAEFS